MIELKFARKFLKNQNANKIKTQKIDSIINDFHKLYYDYGEDERVWQSTYWLGVKTAKNPLDLWIFQEIIFETKPDLIIETGSFMGGSALYMATICDLVNNGEIISIDINRTDFPKHNRIKFLSGSSIDEEIINQVHNTIEENKKVMVVLDSDHTKKHVLEELKIYGKLVTKGCYMIVEDTNVNGHPVKPEFGDGPMEAVNIFLENNTFFVVDKSREKFFLTFNPNGYLKKIK